MCGRRQGGGDDGFLGVLIRFLWRSLGVGCVLRYGWVDK